MRTLGVIGPTRMPYERMIRIVDITAKLVSNALSHHPGIEATYDVRAMIAIERKLPALPP